MNHTAIYSDRKFTLGRIDPMKNATAKKAAKKSEKKAPAKKKK
jgi:hypothetical protein